MWLPGAPQQQRAKKARDPPDDNEERVVGRESADGKFCRSRLSASEALLERARGAHEAHAVRAPPSRQTRTASPPPHTERAGRPGGPPRRKTAIGSPLPCAPSLSFFCFNSLTEGHAVGRRRPRPGAWPVRDGCVCPARDAGVHPPRAPSFAATNSFARPIRLPLSFLSQGQAPPGQRAGQPAQPVLPRRGPGQAVRQKERQRAENCKGARGRSLCVSLCSARSTRLRLSQPRSIPPSPHR